VYYFATSLKGKVEVWETGMDHRIQYRQSTYALPVFDRRPLFRRCSTASILSEYLRVLVADLVEKVRDRTATYLATAALATRDGGVVRMADGARAKGEEISGAT